MGILYSVLGVIILGNAGCTSLGHKNVSPDRFNYNDAISRSTQEQMLLNLVRLRFFETPVLLSVSSVLFLYEAKQHILSPVLAKDLRKATGKQPFVKEAPVNLVYVADFSRMGNASDADKVFPSVPM